MLNVSFMLLRRKAKDAMATLHHPLSPRPSPRRILSLSCPELVKISLCFFIISPEYQHYPCAICGSLFRVSSLKVGTHLSAATSPSGHRECWEHRASL